MGGGRAWEQLLETVLVGGAREQLFQSVGGGGGAWEQLLGEEGQLLESIGVGGAWASSLVVQISLSDTICHTSAGLPETPLVSVQVLKGEADVWVDLQVGTKYDP